MKYQNYIFDLYGTLVDIHTDENNEMTTQQGGRIERQSKAAIQKSKLNSIAGHLQFIIGFVLLQRLNVFSFFREKYEDD